MLDHCHRLPFPAPSGVVRVRLHEALTTEIVAGYRALRDDVREWLLAHLTDRATVGSLRSVEAADEAGLCRLAIDFSNEADSVLFRLVWGASNGPVRTHRNFP